MIWRDCIVTFIDVTGTKDAIQRGGSEGTGLMRKLHRLACASVTKKLMPYHDCAYCWNDSVLLLAFWNKDRTGGIHILKEVSKLKERIDKEIKKSYAICVKGQVRAGGIRPRPAEKCIVLRTWSYAMANCFAIESLAKKKKLKDDWYMDSWIANQLGNLSAKTFPMKMKPRDKYRKVLRFSDDDVKKLVCEIV